LRPTATPASQASSCVAWPPPRISCLCFHYTSHCVAVSRSRCLVTRALALWRWLGQRGAGRHLELDRTADARAERIGVVHKDVQPPPQLLRPMERSRAEQDRLYTTDRLRTKARFCVATMLIYCYARSHGAT